MAATARNQFKTRKIVELENGLKLDHLVNCPFESGNLITYRAINYKKLEPKDNVNYRGTCDLEVTVGNNETIMYKGVKVSPLLCYKMETNPWYFSEFKSFNTSKSFEANPLKLVISPDKQVFKLYLVYERGGEKVDMLNADGTITEGFIYKHRSPDNFVRFFQQKEKTQ